MHFDEFVKFIYFVKGKFGIFLNRFMNLSAMLLMYGTTKYFFFIFSCERDVL